MKIPNEFKVIIKLEPVEYDQTHKLVDNYTSDAPQYHQCGFGAQLVQQSDEFKHAIVGGEIGDDEQDTIRPLNYTTVCT